MDYEKIEDLLVRLNMAWLYAKRNGDYTSLKKRLNELNKYIQDEENRVPETPYTYDTIYDQNSPNDSGSRKGGNPVPPKSEDPEDFYSDFPD